MVYGKAIGGHSMAKRGEKKFEDKERGIRCLETFEKQWKRKKMDGWRIQIGKKSGTNSL